MNKKALALSALNLKPTPICPVMPHWWGVYKYQLAGIVSGPEDEEKGWMLSGEKLAKVDIHFYETFKPDIFHLSEGVWREQPGDVERRRALGELRPGVVELTSKSIIDDYVKYAYPSTEEYLAAGVFDHVRIIAEHYGEDVLILLNQGNPVCGIFENNGPVGDFNDALIATVEHPDNLGYLTYKLYEASLTRIDALKAMGAHGYIGSETCVSCDILSPAAFRSLIAPALGMFYRAVAAKGMEGIVYFLGEINPILNDIANLGAKGLMIEEQKKNFHLDAVDIYRKLDGKMALFGNVDSVYHLLHGTTGDVVKETSRQCSQTGPGFIAASGSPLCYDTPKANIQAMMDTARMSRGNEYESANH